MADLLLEPTGRSSSPFEIITPSSPFFQRYYLIQLLGQTPWFMTFLAINLEQVGHPYCVVQAWLLNQPDEELRQNLRQLCNLERALKQCTDLRSRIAPIQHTIETEQFFYRVRDYIPGVSLASPCIPTQWSEPEIVHILQETLIILATIHRYSFIHGNLHPGNLILHHQDSRVVLTDLRIPVVLASDGLSPSNRTRWATGDRPSPFSYGDPEQWRGVSCPASDLYALGLIGIQLLTGLKPWQYPDPSNPETGFEHQRVCLDSRLRETLLRMVAIAPEDRFTSAEEALQSLSWSDSDLSYQTIAVDHRPSLPHGVDRQTRHPKFHEAGLEEPQFSLPETNPSPAPRHPYQSTRLFLFLTLFISGIYLGFRNSDSIERLWSPDVTRLTQANQYYQRGKFQAAVELARTIQPESSLYQEAQATVTQWQQEWQHAQQLMAHLKAAQHEQDWNKVLHLCTQLPDTEFWSTQRLTLEQQAKVELDRQGQQLLQQAFTHASNRNFVTALALLHQISPNSQVYSRVPQKMKEYARDRDIRANYYLQQAFNHAQVQDFDTALVYLNRIDPTTSPYSLAQQKLLDYQEQQQIRTQYLFSRAANRAILHDYTGAILLLHHIPRNNPAFGAAQAQILVYGEKSRHSLAQTNTPEEIQTTLWPVPTRSLPFASPPFPSPTITASTMVNE